MDNNELLKIWCFCELPGDGFYKVSHKTCCELCNKFNPESQEYLNDDIMFRFDIDFIKVFPENKSKKGEKKMTANQARYNRNRKIKTAYNRGQSLRSLAREYGLHHKSVWRIVNFGKNISFV